MAGALAIPVLYNAWTSATGHPFITGAWLFIEGLWVVVVLLWLAAWDLGAWVSGVPPLSNPIAALIAPRWLVERFSMEWRRRFRTFFDRYIHVIGLVVGLVIGHVYWH